MSNALFILGWAAVFATFTGLFVVMGILEGLATGDIAITAMCWCAALMTAGMGVLVVGELL